jgi:hypothetical protein
MSTTSVTDDEICVLALIWTSDVELELFCVGGMSCNRPMFHGCTITNLNITINKWKCIKFPPLKLSRSRGHTKFLLIPFSYLWHSLFNDIKYLSRDILCTEVSHKGKSFSIFLNQHKLNNSFFFKLHTTVWFCI